MDPEFYNLVLSSDILTLGMKKHKNVFDEALCAQLLARTEFDSNEQNLNIP